MTNVHVAAYLGEQAQKNVDQCDISAQRVLNELARVAFSDIRHVVGVKGNRVTITDFDDLTDDQAAAISEVCQTKDGIRLKTYDKLNALAKLGEHLKLFTNGLEVKVNLDEALAAATERIATRGISPLLAAVLQKKGAK